MSRKTYRICLLMLIVAGMLGGLLFYRFNDSKEPALEKGMFVKQTEGMQLDEEFLSEKRQYEG